MQGLTRERVGHLCRRPKGLGRQPAGATIGRITDQAVTGIGQVHPDLMGAPGFQPAFDQCCGGLKLLHHTHAGYGMAANAVPDHGLTLTVRLVTRQFRGDAQNAACLDRNAAQAAQARVTGCEKPVHHGQIAARDGMFLELPGQPVMSAVGFRDDQQAGGVLVDPVDNARTPLATDAR